MIKVEMKGLKEAEKNLRELAKEFEPKNAVQAMRPAMKAGLEGVEDKLADATPVDSGGLKSTIDTKIKKPSKKDLKSKHTPQNAVIIGRVGYMWKGNPSYWNQALAVEFGNEKITGSAPIRTTFDTEVDQMLKRFKDALGPAIEKKIKQLYKKRGKR